MSCSDSWLNLGEYLLGLDVAGVPTSQTVLHKRPPQHRRGCWKKAWEPSLFSQQTSFQLGVVTQTPLLHACHGISNSLGIWPDLVQYLPNPATCWQKRCYAFPCWFWISFALLMTLNIKLTSRLKMSWRASSVTLHAWATEIALMTFLRRKNGNPMKASSATLHAWATEIAPMTFLRKKNGNPMKASSATLHAWVTEIAPMTFLRRKNRNPMKASSVTLHAEPLK